MSELADVNKSVTVPVAAEEAFRIFVEEPLEWMPPGHRFIRDAVTALIEPGIGGRFFEQGPDGAVAVHGVVRMWEPARRLAMTWRIGENWQPIDNDDHASLIEVVFTPVGPHSTNVVLTHSQFHRHGPLAAAIHAAVDGQSPGETLARYAEAVGRRAAAPQP